ncbi:MAG: hypothetical protein ACTSU5_21695 [Promethearchaeota archaeon]
MNSVKTGDHDPIELVATFLHQLYWLVRQEVPTIETGLFADCLGPKVSIVGDIVDFINGEVGGSALRLETGACSEAVEVVDPVGLGKFASRVIDPRVFSDLYSWREFEEFIHVLCAQNGFASTTNFRFTRSRTKKRWEVDVVAARDGLALAIDGKRWARRGTVASSLKRAGEEQARRVKDLCAERRAAEKLFGELCVDWGGGFFVPVVVTSKTSPIALTRDRVPVVSIFQFQEFVESVGDNLDRVKKFRLPPLPKQATLPVVPSGVRRGPSTASAAPSPCAPRRSRCRSSTAVK